ncbi:MAG: hypothetical protein JNK05_01810 [Myxococcales bacterium]|nr:hypothetical protein [Myxococcales bacterium]
MSSNLVRAAGIARSLALVALTAGAGCTRPSATGEPPPREPRQFGQITCQCDPEAGAFPNRATPNGECTPEALDAGCQTFYPAGGALPPPELAA